MLWVPGVDEKPFSISIMCGEKFGVTVEKKGGFTEALFSMRAGDKIGIRGPYGNGFKAVKGKTCVIGGGCGIAPVMPLVKKLDNPTVIIGCKTQELLLFTDDTAGFDVCTDDGSFGFHGFTTERFEQVLDQDEHKPGENFDMVYTCGPEHMMKIVVDICRDKKVPVQASLERFMICGIGICAQCMCGNQRVCREGPVFSGEELLKLKDFGTSAMIKTGEKVPLKDYYAYKTPY